MIIFTFMDTLMGKYFKVSFPMHNIFIFLKKYNFYQFFICQVWTFSLTYLVIYNGINSMAIHLKFHGPFLKYVKLLYEINVHFHTLQNMFLEKIFIYLKYTILINMAYWAILLKKIKEMPKRKHSGHGQLVFPR
jgi:hypothetical protein